MEIKRHVILNVEEVKEALEEYLSRKNIGYQIDDMIFVEEDNSFGGIEVVMY